MESVNQIPPQHVSPSRKRPVANIPASALSMRVQIEILYDARLIGSADLSKLDPPMGGAVGNLNPGGAYDRVRHATDIEDRENPFARAE